MSLIDVPLALLDRVLGRRDARPDDPIVRSLEQELGRLDPDPLFERRLRAEMINRYIAQREARTNRRARSEMGRLGRAVLYASFALTVSATAVGAAAQQSLPGEALYAVKLRLEQVRIEIAPASLRPQLMAMELQARLEEAEQLALRGDWAGVGRAAALVDRAAAQVAAAGLDEGAPALSGVQRHTEVLTRIAADAPQSAREGLQRAIDASTAAATGDHGSAGNGNANGSGNGNANGAGNGSASHAPDPSPGQNNAGGQSADHTPKADPSPGAGRR